MVCGAWSGYLWVVYGWAGVREVGLKGKCRGGRMEVGRWSLGWRLELGGLWCLEWLFVGDVWMGGWSDGRR